MQPMGAGGLDAEVFHGKRFIPHLLHHFHSQLPHLCNGESRQEFPHERQHIARSGTARLCGPCRYTSAAAWQRADRWAVAWPVPAVRTRSAATTGGRPEPAWNGWWPATGLHHPHPGKSISSSLGLMRRCWTESGRSPGRYLHLPRYRPGDLPLSDPASALPHQARGTGDHSSPG